MNTLAIQTATMADLYTLSDMEKTIFDYDVLTSKRLSYLLKSKTARVAKAISENITTGYMILLTRKNSRVLRIYSLGVLKEARRHGLGGMLLQHAEHYAAERDCERIHLELHVKNTPALIFYLSEGYSLYGRREHYYTDGAQALLLRKLILPGARS